MSLPNGSIANLFVTRKSLITSNLECPSPVPFPIRTGGLVDGRANKKAGAGGAPAVAGIRNRRWKGAGMPRIKSRRWKGAGWAQGIFLAALGGERIAR
jgi:hypothetical protein